MEWNRDLRCSAGCVSRILRLKGFIPFGRLVRTCSVRKGLVSLQKARIGPVRHLHVYLDVVSAAHRCKPHDRLGEYSDGPANAVERYGRKGALAL